MESQQNQENDKGEIIQRIKKTQDLKLSRAIKTKRLLEAYGKHKKYKISLIPITGPVMLFGRVTGTWEIYDKVTTGEFEFKHSNGEKRYIIVNPHTKEKLSDGKNYIPLYLAHENHPTTGWPDAITTAEQMNMFGEKLLNDMKQWLAKLEGMKNMKIVYWCAGIALVFIGFGLMKAIIPPTPIVNTVYACTDIAQQAYQNASNILNVAMNISPPG